MTLRKQVVQELRQEFQKFAHEECPTFANRNSLVGIERKFGYVERNADNDPELTIIGMSFQAIRNATRSEEYRTGTRVSRDIEPADICLLDSDSWKEIGNDLGLDTADKAWIQDILVNDGIECTESKEVECIFPTRERKIAVSFNHGYNIGGMWLPVISTCYEDDEEEDWGVVRQETGDGSLQIAREHIQDNKKFQQLMLAGIEIDLVRQAQRVEQCAGWSRVFVLSDSIPR